MKIRNHRLYLDDNTKVPFVPTNNKGEIIEPKFLIMHYTASPSAESTINWFKNPKSRASAHVVISRSGEVTQMIPFNQKAWHAGLSEWNNLVGMNSHSIGIELENAGKLTPHTNNNWRSWFGTLYHEEEVLEAMHKYEEEFAGWHLFTAAQLEAAVEVALTVVNYYGLMEVIGHEDVAPTRKVDPGPAFPMMSFRSKVMGRLDDSSRLFETTTDLNIRSGPGVDYPPLEFSPLKENTRVEILNSFEVWKFVQVVNHPKKSEARGWVHGRYLQEMDFIF